MTFKEIGTKSSYDSEEDDIVESFYIPVLSRAVKYCRLSGFFSSSALAVAARGIASLVANGGHMKLITGVRLKQADIEAIRKGIETPDEVISSMIIKDLDSLENEFVRDHVRALAWMVANKMLEIKVAVVMNRDGLILDGGEAEKLGIFHPKIGILIDKEGNMISFSGSINESAMGWEENIEEFKVFRSWVPGELEYLKADHGKFEKFWLDQAKYVKVLDVPTAVREKFVQIAPESFDELKIIKRRPPRKRIVLRDYQAEAVKNWFKNNKKGIFEMATATGKTFAALVCVQELKKEHGSLAVVIVCPYQHLIFDPWGKRLGEFGFENMLPAFGGFRKWKDKLMNEILDLNNGVSDILIVGTTYDTFSTENFISLINRIKVPVLLIADEVHSAGSEERIKGLTEKYSYRLGLSATPRRWLDDKGTEMIFNFFDKTVYEFSLARAIHEHYLVPYEYYPYFVEMTPEEFEEYKKLSKKIARQYYSSRNREDKQKYYELLLYKRGNIVKNAKNKLAVLEEILDSAKMMNHSLVYCASHKQIKKAQDELDKRGIKNHQFTQIENVKEREKLLKEFDTGKLQALVAVRCLDEGVDVPSIRTAIVLASSGNPKEYIQRRGRILRKYPGKEKAIIHDILVVPTLGGNIPSEFLELERKILEKEFKRYKEFAELATNYLSAFNEAYPILKKYQIAI